MDYGIEFEPQGKLFEFFFFVIIFTYFFCFFNRNLQEGTLEVDGGNLEAQRSPGKLRQLNTDTGLYVGKFHLTIGVFN